MVAKPIDEAKPGDTQHKPIALVFLPGITRAWGDDALLGVARRIAYALGRQTKGGSFEASGRVVPTEVPGRVRRVPTVSIIEKAPGKPERTYVDVYGIDHRPDVVAPYERYVSLFRTWLILVAVICNVPALVRLLAPAHRKRVAGPWQLALGMGVMGAYSLSLILVVIALVQNGASFLASAGLHAPQVLGPGLAMVGHETPFPSWVAWLGNEFKPLVQALVGVYFVTGLAWLVAWFGAIVGAWLDVGWKLVAAGWLLAWTLLPPKAKIKEALSTAVTDMLAMDRYVRAGAGRNELEGWLEDVVDSISDAGAHREIYVVGYSFGSVAAINALFPPDSKLQRARNRSAMDEVTRLVTIGCPFDVIRALHCRYFVGRTKTRAQTKDFWLNIFSRTDVLGSNFRNDDLPEDADPCVMCGTNMPVPTNVLTPNGRDQVDFLEQLTLVGLQEHGRYWNQADANSMERNCFDEMVRWLFT